jgi:hypothetical protein|nr:MAG TPA: tail fiber protein [Caudoviricetes sp.]
MTAAIKINANDGVTRNVMVGGETEVDFDFPIFAATHLKVYETDSNGDITLLVKDTDYTVPAGSVGQQAGGTIELDGTQYPSGATAGHVFTVYQAAPEARTTDFNQAGDFFADTLNQELDLITQQIQQLRRDLGRAAQIPVDSTLSGVTLPDPEDGKLLIWDGVLGAIGNGPTADNIAAAQGYANDAETAKDAAEVAQAAAELAASNLPLNKLNGTAAPTVNDDSGDGYSVGSKWYDLTGDEAYVCLDATAGAAVWVITTLDTEDLGTAAFVDVIDEDSFATDSATRPPSQQSVKAYTYSKAAVDAAVAAVTPRVGAVSTPSTPSIGANTQWTGGDGWLAITITISTASASSVTKYDLACDSSSTPTAVLASGYCYGHANAHYATSQTITLAFPIRNNDYFKINETLLAGSAVAESIVIKFRAIGTT